eukprot:g4431.t1
MHVARSMSTDSEHHSNMEGRYDPSKSVSKKVQDANNFLTEMESRFTSLYSPGKSSGSSYRSKSGEKGHYPQRPSRVRPPRYLREDQPRNKFIVDPKSVVMSSVDSEAKHAEQLLADLDSGRVNRVRRWNPRRRRRRRRRKKSAEKSRMRRKRKGGSKNTRNDIPENKFDHGSGGMRVKRKRSQRRALQNGGIDEKWVKEIVLQVDNDDRAIPSTVMPSRDGKEKLHLEAVQRQFIKMPTDWVAERLPSLKDLALEEPQLRQSLELRMQSLEGEKTTGKEKAWSSFPEKLRVEMHNYHREKRTSASKESHGLLQEHSLRERTSVTGPEYRDSANHLHFISAREGGDRETVEEYTRYLHDMILKKEMIRKKRVRMLVKAKVKEALKFGKKVNPSILESSARSIVAEEEKHEHVRSGNDIIYERVVEAQRRPPGEKGKDSIREFAEHLSHVEEEVRVLHIQKSGGTNFLATNAFASVRLTKEAKKNSIQKMGSSAREHGDSVRRRRKMLRMQQDENVQKRIATRIERHKGIGKMKIRAEMQRQWLQHIKAFSFFLGATQPVRDRNLRAGAAIVLQSMFRKTCFRSKTNGYFKAVRVVKKFIFNHIGTFRLRIRNKSSDKLRHFLIALSEMNTIKVAMKQFRSKVKFIQKLIRDFLAVSRGRLSILEARFIDAEAMRRENLLQYGQQMIQHRKVQAMDPYMRRNLQRKFKMEALQLTSSGSRQTSRIEKHLSALHDAELAYEDFKAVNIGAKVPAKIRRQVLRKYLRECRQANIRKSMTKSTKETVKKNANGDTDTSLLLTIEDARDIMRSLETDTKESSTGKLTSRHRKLKAAQPFVSNIQDSDEYSDAFTDYSDDDFDDLDAEVEALSEVKNPDAVGSTVAADPADGEDIHTTVPEHGETGVAENVTLEKERKMLIATGDTDYRDSFPISKPEKDIDSDDYSDAEFSDEEPEGRDALSEETMRTKKVVHFADKAAPDDEYTAQDSVALPSITIEKNKSIVVSKEMRLSHTPLYVSSHAERLHNMFLRKGPSLPKLVLSRKELLEQMDRMTLSQTGQVRLGTYSQTHEKRRRRKRTKKGRKKSFDSDRRPPVIASYQAYNILGHDLKAMAMSRSESLLEDDNLPRLPTADRYEWLFSRLLSTIQNYRIRISDCFRSIDRDQDNIISIIDMYETLQMLSIPSTMSDAKGVCQNIMRKSGRYGASVDFAAFRQAVRQADGQRAKSLVKRQKSLAHARSSLYGAIDAAKEMNRVPKFPAAGSAFIDASRCINDEAGQKFWNEKFGRDVASVSTKRFMFELESHMKEQELERSMKKSRSKISVKMQRRLLSKLSPKSSKARRASQKRGRGNAHDQKRERALKRIRVIVSGDRSMVSAAQFSQFLSLFGPFQDCLTKVMKRNGRRRRKGQ